MVLINVLIGIIAKIGEITLDILFVIGRKITFTGVGLLNIFLAPVYIKNARNQFVEIAFFSIPLVGLTALFTGMVLALQSYIGFSRFVSAESAIANVVAISIVRELAPVLTALMVAGRISSSIAAEIATMKVSEQLDALYSMKVDPFKYLITPKIIAGIFALPLLALLADIIGIMGGYLISVIKLDFTSVTYLQNTWSFLMPWDILSGLIKAVIFGLIITSMGCFFGYFCEKGAKGVGRATTNAVVFASIFIFIFDYILTLWFFKS